MAAAVKSIGSHNSLFNLIGNTGLNTIKIIENNTIVELTLFIFL